MAKQTRPSTEGVVHDGDILHDVLKGLLIKTAFANRNKPKRNSTRGVSYSSITANIFKESDGNSAKITPDDTVYYRLPSILRTPDGDLHVVCAELHYGLRDIGGSDNQRINIVYKTSTDNGITWSERRVLVDMGGNFQNSEPSIVYNEKEDTIYVFFTSCKGMLGWGYSQSGTIDIDKSSQIYYMKMSLLDRTWSDPVNITSQVKAHEVGFIFTSPCKPVALADGTMLVPLATVTDNVCVSWVMVFKDGKSLGLHRMGIADKETGGEVGLHVTSGGELIAHSRAYGDTQTGAGQQVIYKTSDGMKTWQKIAQFATVDCKGDMALIADSSDSERPLWIMCAPNGPNDDGLGSRSNQRIFVSHDLVHWRATPRTGLRDAYIGYIGLSGGCFDDEVVTATEVSGFTGIVFTAFSQSHFRQLKVQGTAGDIKRVRSSHMYNLMSSGGIRDGEIFKVEDKDIIAMNNKGEPVFLYSLNPSLNLTSTYREKVIDVSGKSLIMIDSGQYDLHGMSGGVLGQVITLASSSSSAWRNLVHTTDASPEIPAAQRFHFIKPSSNTKVQVRNNVQICVRAVLTQYGWFVETPANIT